MKKNIRSIEILNIFSTLLFHLANLINVFIVTKIILFYFGSSVNGLISSIGQFLYYINLVEGGISGVVMAKLYKPIVSKNINQISSIIVTAQKFYTKITLVYILFSVVLAIVYPLIFNTDFSYIYVFSLTLILAFRSIMEYMFSLNLKTLLKADKKIYIVEFTESIFVILNVFLAYLSVVIYPSIHFLKIITGILYIIPPIIFSLFIKKYFPNIDKKAKANSSLIKDRWNGLAVNLANFIHGGTDVVVLTFFTSLNVVSIYNVYSLVLTALRRVVYSISSSLSPTMGQDYVIKDNDLFEKEFNLFEFLIVIISCYIFTVAILLITPFVCYYTTGISDINYNQPIFGFLILISELLYVVKFAHDELAYSTNKFKEITIPCFIEAGINLIVSIILVKKLGLIGVAIGTICAMTYRLIFQVKFTNKIIKGRSSLKFYKKLICFTTSSLIGCYICTIIAPNVDITLIDLILKGFIYSIIIGLFYFITCMIFFRDDFTTLIRKVLKLK